eukprot:scaffold17108_cov33-Phaeocystis_antarctica.AAC.2
MQLCDGELLVCNSSRASLCEYFSHFEDVAGCFLALSQAVQEAATPPKNSSKQRQLSRQSDPRELRHASAFNLPPPPRSTERLLRAALLVLNLRRAPPCRRRR